MRDTDDKVTVFFLEDVCHLLRYLYRVEILRGPIVFVINQPVELRGESEDTNLPGLCA